MSASPLLMLDLFSGLGGASKVMRARGWEVIRVEIDPDLPAEWRDVRTFTWRGHRPDLIWASPPCTEFSTANPLRVRTDTPPASIELLRHARRIIGECQPRRWVIENVHGAVRYFMPILGEHIQAIGPFFLWGNFDPLPVDPAPIVGWKSRKFRRYHDRAADRRACARARAEIPSDISAALCEQVERQLDLGLMTAALERARLLR